eukprot:g1492.t1
MEAVGSFWESFRNKHPGFDEFALAEEGNDPGCLSVPQQRHWFERHVGKTLHRPAARGRGKKVVTVREFMKVLALAADGKPGTFAEEKIAVEIFPAFQRKYPAPMTAIAQLVREKREAEAPGEERVRAAPKSVDEIKNRAERGVLTKMQKWIASYDTLFEHLAMDQALWQQLDEYAKDFSPPVQMTPRYPAHPQEQFIEQQLKKTTDKVDKVGERLRLMMDVRKHLSDKYAEWLGKFDRQDEYDQAAPRQEHDDELFSEGGRVLAEMEERFKKMEDGLDRFDVKQMKEMLEEEVTQTPSMQTLTLDRRAKQVKKALGEPEVTHIMRHLSPSITTEEQHDGNVFVSWHKFATPVDRVVSEAVSGMNTPMGHLFERLRHVGRDLLERFRLADRGSHSKPLLIAFTKFTSEVDERLREVGRQKVLLDMALWQRWKRECSGAGGGKGGEDGDGGEEARKKLESARANMEREYDSLVKFSFRLHVQEAEQRLETFRAELQKIVDGKRRAANEKTMEEGMRTQLLERWERNEKTLFEKHHTLNFYSALQAMNDDLPARRDTFWEQASGLAEEDRTQVWNEYKSAADEALEWWRTTDEDESDAGDVVVEMKQSDHDDGHDREERSGSRSTQQRAAAAEDAERILEDEKEIDGLSNDLANLKVVEMDKEKVKQGGVLERPAAGASESVSAGASESVSSSPAPTSSQKKPPKKKDNPFAAALRGKAGMFGGNKASKAKASSQVDHDGQDRADTNEQKTTTSKDEGAAEDPVMKQMTARDEVFEASQFAREQVDAIQRRRTNWLQKVSDKLESAERNRYLGEKQKAAANPNAPSEQPEMRMRTIARERLLSRFLQPDITALERASKNAIEQEEAKAFGLLHAPFSPGRGDGPSPAAEPPFMKGDAGWAWRLEWAEFMEGGIERNIGTMSETEILGADDQAEAEAIQNLEEVSGSAMAAFVAFESFLHSDRWTRLLHLFHTLGERAVNRSAWPPQVIDPKQQHFLRSGHGLILKHDDLDTVDLDTQEHDEATDEYDRSTLGHQFLDAERFKHDSGVTEAIAELLHFLTKDLLFEKVVEPLRKVWHQTALPPHADELLCDLFDAEIIDHTYDNGSGTAFSFASNFSTTPAIVHPNPGGRVWPAGRAPAEQQKDAANLEYWLHREDVDAEEHQHLQHQPDDPAAPNRKGRAGANRKMEKVGYAFFSRQVPHKLVEAERRRRDRILKGKVDTDDWEEGGADMLRSTREAAAIREFSQWTHPAFLYVVRRIAAQYLGLPHEYASLYEDNMDIDDDGKGKLLRPPVGPEDERTTASLRLTAGNDFSSVGGTTFNWDFGPHLQGDISTNFKRYAVDDVLQQLYTGHRPNKAELKEDTDNRLIERSDILQFQARNKHDKEHFRNLLQNLVHKQDLFLRLYSAGAEDEQERMERSGDYTSRKPPFAMRKTVPQLFREAMAEAGPSSSAGAGVVDLPVFADILLAIRRVQKLYSDFVQLQVATRNVWDPVLDQFADRREQIIAAAKKQQPDGDIAKMKTHLPPPRTAELASAVVKHRDGFEARFAPAFSAGAATVLTLAKVREAYRALVLTPGFVELLALEQSANSDGVLEKNMETKKLSPTAKLMYSYLPKVELAFLEGVVWPIEEEDFVDYLESAGMPDSAFLRLANHFQHGVEPTDEDRLLLSAAFGRVTRFMCRGRA